MAHDTVFVESPLFNEKEKRFEDIVVGGDKVGKADLKYLPELKVGIENLQSSLANILKQRTEAVINTLEFYTGANIKQTHVIYKDPVNFSPTNIILKYDLNQDIDFKRSMLCRDISMYIATTNTMLRKYVPATLLYKSFFEFFEEREMKSTEKIFELKEQLKKIKKELKDVRRGRKKEPTTSK